MSHLEIWNNRNLKPPPTITIKMNVKEKDVTTLSNIISEASSTFKSQTNFEKEAAFLSRFIYCMKTKLRHNKALKATSKIVQALLRYLRLDVAFLLGKFLEALPQRDSETVYMPSRCMLQFLLMKLQGIAKLMARILESCKICAQMLEQLINIGHMWKIYILCYGMVAEIYALSQNMLKYCCKLYSLLFPFELILKNSSNNWLPNGYVLPKDLRLWIGNDFLDDEVSEHLEIKKPFLSLFDYEGSDEHLPDIAIKEIAVKETPETNMEDFGMPIVKTKKKTSKCTVPNIQSFDDLKKFEKEFKKNPAKYNFKKMDKMQCRMLHKFILKCLKKSKNVHNPKKINACLFEVRKVLSSF